MPAPDEPRRSLWVAEDVWKEADQRANADGLPIARTVALLFEGYSSGRITELGSEGTGKRKARSGYCAEKTWKAADKRRAKTNAARSMGMLAELLLSAYASRRLHLVQTFVTTTELELMTRSETDPRTGTPALLAAA
ncbi:MULTISPECIES: hypothetical protein [unclassified Streptomyces]|uniref:hypothetical protein n=1 Tax=unclassified Streptomyces TaxID=2593676 RepID=UPI0032532064